MNHTRRLSQVNLLDTYAIRKVFLVCEIFKLFHTQQILSIRIFCNTRFYIMTGGKKDESELSLLAE